MRKLFTPIKIGNLEIKNRFMMAPMENGHASFGGGINDSITAFLVERAKNDVGIIISGSIAVTPEGRGLPTQLCSYDESLLPGMKTLVDKIHEAGSLFGAQLYHAGRQATQAVTGIQPVAPSAIPCAILGNDPREMNKEDFKRILDAFVIGARRMVDIGFDLIEVHFAHGYLLHSFLSPHSNKRTDEYGGSLENRARYPFQVLKAVMDEVKGQVPVTIRISIDEFLNDGLTFEEAKKICIMAEELGVDAISISAASYDSVEYIIQPMFIPQGFLVKYAEEVKKQVKIPVIVAGRLNSAELIEDIVESGKADMVAIGRGLIADEELVVKIKNKDYKSIRYCIACNQGCIDKVFIGQGAKCLVNPRAGYELTRKVIPAKHKKKVVIIGAGPASLEAARIAKLRGHDVIVLDKVDRIGGKLELLSIPPEKDTFIKFRDYLYNQMVRLGVKFELVNVTSPEQLKPYNPDVVIVATGATQSPPNFPIAPGAHVVMAEDVLTQKVEVGNTVAVIGGGLVGAETAKFLCSQNKNVHIVEALDAIGKDYGATYIGHNLSFLTKKGVISHLNSKVVGAEKGKVVLEHGSIAVDSIVVAVGYRANTALAEELKKHFKEVYTVGDALSPRRVLDASSEGFEVANTI
jgi:2,4-dienoyl-CoA reductase-like NADH-dependent reductase (Old Yellow Enzyme family)/thioredoxin reductase